MGLQDCTQPQPVAAAQNLGKMSRTDKQWMPGAVAKHRYADPSPTRLARFHNAFDQRGLNRGLISQRNQSGLGFTAKRPQTRTHGAEHVAVVLGVSNDRYFLLRELSSDGIVISRHDHQHAANWAGSHLVDDMPDHGLAGEWKEQLLRSHSE